MSETKDQNPFLKWVERAEPGQYATLYTVKKKVGFFRRKTILCWTEEVALEIANDNHRKVRYGEIHAVKLADGTISIFYGPASINLNTVVVKGPTRAGEDALRKLSLDDIAALGLDQKEKS